MRCGVSRFGAARVFCGGGSRTGSGSAPLVVQIVIPADGTTISSAGEAIFQAIAYDPDIATTDGSGISQVIFTILDSGGATAYSHTENIAAYCAFGGDSPCSSMPILQWDALASGTYTFTAEARSVLGKPAVTVSVTFVKP
ncbi:hypothetical protein K2Z83_00760 [Oscillochloris sp. ZM17-4]|uniref:hypothetical protein n=1 Tax=Oscillochloris sp. ZM17-4 TaxID=2866714 RepID=UPI001C72DCC5|nr:hypothetical protein [Oscillochloris sp. ZM17-4]MBX0326223.1 hypothetical protein [Oscillochloris sp. ZM17-4]